MAKSIHSMRARSLKTAPSLIDWMSFELAIPRRVALLQWEYQTGGLDKTVRNKDRVDWSEPFGGGKLKAEGSLVLSQARPAVWSRVLCPSQ
jgi:hypothetical protein